MNRPVHEIRRGGIKASIWLNERNGNPVHSVTITRSFKRGETWHETPSYFRSHLAQMLETLSKAEQWIALREPTVR
jgi:hypothetical protein